MQCVKFGFIYDFYISKSLTWAKLFSQQECNGTLECNLVSLMLSLVHFWYKQAVLLQMFLFLFIYFSHEAVFLKQYYILYYILKTM